MLLGIIILMDFDYKYIDQSRNNHLQIQRLLPCFFLLQLRNHFLSVFLAFIALRSECDGRRLHIKCIDSGSSFLDLEILPSCSGLC